MIQNRRFQVLWAILLVALFLGVPVRASLADESDPVVAPHWIWAVQSKDKRPLPTAKCSRWRLVRRFEAKSSVREAVLRVTANCCDVTVMLNDQPAVRLEAYSPLIEVPVLPLLRGGQNRIEILAEAKGEQPAIAVSVAIHNGAGDRQVVITDENWSVSPWITFPDTDAEPNISEKPATSLGSVAQELWGLDRRSATIDPFDNYEQWRQALGDSPAGKAPAFWAAPGFEITLLRSAQAEEGSWVSMAFDPQGRLTIAKEDKGLLRVTLAADGRSVVRVETINDQLLECRGLLYAHGSLYANANNSKGLYRLRDTDGDDRLDEVRCLREFPGGVGHGRNDLALGPDGMIYSIHGDSVDVPATEIVDFTSPFREARRGQKTSEGHLIRTDREGAKWELVCGGMRNPFGIAFNPAGDLFTYDADAEFDMGSPWYRPTRVLQLRSGADFGWRGVTGKWPPYFPDHPDNALPALDIGKGSPTAVAFGTGSKFPAPYQDALFILDWTYGRVLAVHLAPRGAGYLAQAETFLQGRPLNVTDLAFGPDGALYLVTGGRKTQSALYKVAYVGPEVARPSTSQHERDCRDQAAAARKLLRQLEALHGPADMAAVETAWTHLNEADPVIRYAARIAVEHQPIELWRDRGLTEPRTTAALEALLALARSGDKQPVDSIVQRLLAFPIADLNVSQTLSLLHLYSLCLDRTPEATLPHKLRIIAQLDAAFAVSPHCLQVGPAGSSVNVQRALAQLLGQLGSPTVVEKTSRTLLLSTTQEDRLHALFTLRNIRAGWTLDSRRAYFTALNDGRQFLSGEGMPKFLTQLRDDAVAALTEAERAALADFIAAPAETAETDLKLPNRPIVKAWAIDDFTELVADPNRQGNAQQGEMVFRDALCVRCHRVGARGPAVGPDLTHVASRFSRRDMLESILTPSQVVAENYRNVQVLLTDGRVLVGRTLSEGDYRSEKLRLAADPLRPSQVIEISKRDIEKYQLSETSPMPKGLLDAFSSSEVLDLLAYLQGGAAK